jgi:hypothetical protein
LIIADDIEKLSNYRYELAVLMVNLRKKRGKQAKLSKKHTSLAIMGRMYGRGKGKAQSAIPYSRKAPAWVKVQIFTFLLNFFIKFASTSIVFLSFHFHRQIFNFVTIFQQTKPEEVKEKICTAARKGMVRFLLFSSFLFQFSTVSEKVI